MGFLKKFVIVLIVTVVGIAAVCVVGTRMLQKYGEEYYSDKFFSGTVINGIDVSEMSVAQAVDAMQEHVNGYSLEIKERNNRTETITGEELDFKYVDDGSIQALFEEQDTEMWRYHLNRTREYNIDAGFTYDQKLVKERVEALDCFKPENIVKAENAYIAMDDTGFYIVPEVIGTDPDLEKVMAVVNDALSKSMLSVNIEEAGVYNDPTIYSDNQDLNYLLNTDNNILTTNVTYDFRDRTWNVNADTIRPWLILNQDGTVTVDYNQAYAWVAAMAYETDTFALTRDFVTSTGQTIKLEKGGDYGWYMDKDDTTDQLVAHIYAGDIITCDPDYVYVACDRSTNDIGGTYVEVCIESQTLWCYKDGQLVVTAPVITGNVSTGHSTPSGSVWAIDGKKEDFKFTHFANTSCKYWLPFNDECGLHDATWQADEYYTTTYYLTNGSHGCVNMKLETMTKVFEVMEIGYPVVVYYSVNQVHGPDPTQELVAG